MAKHMLGSALLAQTLHDQGVRTVYGVPGIPITSVAEALIAKGVNYIAFRNEQSASYAASVHAYINDQFSIGVLLTTGGPGFVHSLAGIVNARENLWPLLVIVGTCRNSHKSTSCFQDCRHDLFLQNDQFVHFRRLCSEDTHDISGVIAHLIQQTKSSIGHSKIISILEVSSKWLEMTLEYLPAESCLFSAQETAFNGKDMIQNALNDIKKAQRPLIVFGKGACLGRLDELALELVETTGVPFLLMPMAKGLIREDHPLCMSAARTKALADATLLILIGARANWMLPVDRMLTNSQLQILRIDIQSKDAALNKMESDNIRSIIGDCREVIGALIQEMESKFEYPEWIATLQTAKEANVQRVLSLSIDESLPLGYHAVYKTLSKYIIEDTTVVAEGSNTMDIARVMLPTYRPRYRLDAGTFAAMGIGMSYAIAAALTRPNEPILYVAGDSAFGFSLAELETAARYGLSNLTVLVMNNSGVYSGVTKEEFAAKCRETPIPRHKPTALTPNTRYDKLAEMLPEMAQGFLVETLDDLNHALQSKSPILISVINVLIRTANQ
ncbi:putative thiamine pyrophosphate-requiring enzyme [Paramicrosporidium saccamoebae]|uniref:2-hydroxyacyl-CoA lyase n=1 Tax=Paramicrosporidium saccamoebae TaxID=1246581 RepID=A0A2H9TL62_9FUNG|nr:putative thiamine pyrophosphate-requiring enzyme [Paramicrosporidium saccamoebae]